MNFRIDLLVLMIMVKESNNLKKMLKDSKNLKKHKIIRSKT